MVRQRAMPAVQNPGRSGGATCFGRAGYASTQAGDAPLWEGSAAATEVLLRTPLGPARFGPRLAGDTRKAAWALFRGRQALGTFLGFFPLQAAEFALNVE